MTPATRGKGATDLRAPAAGGTVGLAAGGITGWGVGMAGGAFLGLVIGMFLALAIVNTQAKRT